MSSARALAVLIRPRDWVKNALVLAPLLFGARLFEPAAVGHTVLAAVAYCLAASAGYVWNDYADRAADRLHPLKRKRPLASGAIGATQALSLSFGLAAGALLLAATLPTGVLRCVLASLALMAVYSFWLKRVAIVDVLAIGTFYVLRVLAGSYATEVPASDWLLLATGLVAIFLGLCKRRHELLLLGEDARDHRATLGRYGSRFLDSAISLTTSTTLIAYLLYAVSPETVAKFGSRGMLAGAPFVFYGLLRYLHLVYTEGRGGSPTELVATDPGVLTAAVGFAITCGLVIYL
jgi:4-hydroxybenzoate polyprenyltransferase